MASLNRVMLIGRLGQDPKLAYLPSGQPVCEFSLATDESYKDKNGNKVEKTEWHKIKVWGRSAEVAGNMLTKGRLIYVEGKLTTRKWQDQQGQDRYITEVNCQGFQFLDRAPEGQGQQGGHQGYGRSQGGGQRQGGYQGVQQGGGQSDDEDLGPAFPSESGGMDDVPF